MLIFKPLLPKYHEFIHYLKNIDKRDYIQIMDHFILKPKELLRIT